MRNVGEETMKIIVCGAGNVGRSIVSYLILGNNDIVVIDNNAENLNALSKEFDIQPILGPASHPETLERAGAENTDMIIAVTGIDEVNMVACEVGSALFNIPKKIARIDSQDFLNPLWGGLFNDKHIPVDLVISPSFAIAEEITSLIKIQGMSKVTPLLKNKVHMLSFCCKQNERLNNLSIRQFENYVPESNCKVICIIHNGSSFIPTSEYKIQNNDTLYFLVATSHIDIVLRELNMEKSAIEKLIIFGGNEISRYLATKLEKNDNILSYRIIEEDPSMAKRLAKKLKNTAVINGDMMSDVILEEAGIDSCDAIIATLPHNNDNLLISLLAKQHNIPISLSLINGAFYNNFIENISDSTLVDGSAVIISSILQELRKAKMRDAYSLGHNFGEIWEISLGEENLCIGQKLKDIDMPVSCQTCAILRKDTLIIPEENTVLEANDILILYVGTKGVKKAEKLFA